MSKKYKKQGNVYNLSEIYLLASALKQAEREQARVIELINLAV